MAVWQYDLLVIPRTRIEQFACSMLDADVYQQREWWDDSITSQQVAARIDAILERGRSWLKDLMIWGPEDGNRVDLYVTGNVVSELLVRIDLRIFDARFLSDVISLVRDLDGVFCTEDWTLIDPNLKSLTDSMLRSDAARFVAGPEDFLRKLREEN